jgi:hypothetical protein
MLARASAQRKSKLKQPQRLKGDPVPRLIQLPEIAGVCQQWHSKHRPISTDYRVMQRHLVLQAILIRTRSKSRNVSSLNSPLVEMLYGLESDSSEADY